MLSNFHVTVSVWLPDRLTAGFAPSVNVNFVMEQAVVSALHVATELYAPVLSTPALPTAFCHWLGPPPGPVFQVTSDALHVVAPATGGVNDGAFARTEILSCFVAVVSTMFWTLKATLPFEVLDDTLSTLKEMPAGTVIRACSATAAVNVVVCVVSVSGIVVCAMAGRPVSNDRTITTPPICRTPRASPS
ncbi:hypothetical protein BH24ACI5_BH24ACI5_21210 [soil metagenome]